LSTAVAWYCWYKGLETLDAGTVAVYFFAQPVVGAALGALLLGESIGPGFVAGGVILGVGIYLVSTARSEWSIGATPYTDGASGLVDNPELSKLYLGG